MSKGAKGRAEEARTKPATATPRLMPSTWRAVLFSALLLLFGYTALTAFKLMHASAQPTAAPVLKAEADVSAARADSIIALSRAGLRVGTDRLSAAPDHPLDALEAALAIGQTSLAGGAVVSDTDLAAVKGAEPTALWRKVVLAVNGQAVWVGVVDGRLFLAGSPIGPRRQRLILDLDFTSALSQASAEEDLAVVSAEGVVLARKGPVWLGEATLQSLGMGANTVRGLTGGDIGTGHTPDGHALRIAAAATSDDTIMTLASEPMLAPGAAGPTSRKFADEMFTLLAPARGRAFAHSHSRAPDPQGQRSGRGSGR